jgi:hypothetical protein
VKSDLPISFINEQIIPDWGLAVTIKAVNPPGPDPSIAGVEWEENNGLIGSTLEYANTNKQWLTGVPDVDGVPFLDWIRSGLDETDLAGQDDNAAFETLFGGRPLRLVWCKLTALPDLACQCDRLSV